jgi:hypothetical protein
LLVVRSPWTKSGTLRGLERGSTSRRGCGERAFERFSRAAAVWIQRSATRCAQGRLQCVPWLRRHSAATPDARARSRDQQNDRLGCEAEGRGSHRVTGLFVRQWRPAFAQSVSAQRTLVPQASRSLSQETGEEIDPTKLTAARPVPGLNVYRQWLVWRSRRENCRAPSPDTAIASGESLPLRSCWRCQRSLAPRQSLPVQPTRQRFTNVPRPDVPPFNTRRTGAFNEPPRPGTHSGKPPRARLLEGPPAPVPAMSSITHRSA